MGHHALQSFCMYSSRHVVQKLKASTMLYRLLYCSQLLHGVRSEEPRKHGVKWYQLPGYAVGQRQHERKLVAFQVTCRADVFSTSQIQNRRGEMQLFAHNTGFGISNDDCKKLGTYYECFESHVSPKANLVFARFKFHSQVQDSSETAEKFITALQILAQDFDCKDSEGMIKDQIVFGTNSIKSEKS